MEGWPLSGISGFELLVDVTDCSTAMIIKGGKGVVARGRLQALDLAGRLIKAADSILEQNCIEGVHLNENLAGLYQDLIIADLNLREDMLLSNFEEDNGGLEP